MIYSKEIKDQLRQAKLNLARAMKHYESLDSASTAHARSIRAYIVMCQDILARINSMPEDML